MPSSLPVLVIRPKELDGVFSSKEEDIAPIAVSEYMTTDGENAAVAGTLVKDYGFVGRDKNCLDGAPVRRKLVLKDVRSETIFDFFAYDYWALELNKTPLNLGDVIELHNFQYWRSPVSRKVVLQSSKPNGREFGKHVEIRKIVVKREVHTTSNVRDREGVTDSQYFTPEEDPESLQILSKSVSFDLSPSPPSSPKKITRSSQLKPSLKSPQKLTFTELKSSEREDKSVRKSPRKAGPKSSENGPKSPDKFGQNSLQKTGQTVADFGQKSTQKSPQKTKQTVADLGQKSTLKSPLKTGQTNADFGQKSPDKNTALAISTRLKNYTVLKQIYADRKARFNAFGVVNYVTREVKPTTTGRYMGQYMLQDESCERPDGRIDSFQFSILSDDATFPDIKYGSILRIHAIRAELWLKEVTGRVFTTKAVQVLGNADTKSDELEFTSKSAKFDEEDRLRCQELADWWRSNSGSADVKISDVTEAFGESYKRFALTVKVICTANYHDDQTVLNVSDGTECRVSVRGIQDYDSSSQLIRLDYRPHRWAVDVFVSNKDHQDLIRKALPGKTLQLSGVMLVRDVDGFQFKLSKESWAEVVEPTTQSDPLFQNTVTIDNPASDSDSFVSILSANKRPLTRAMAATQTSQKSPEKRKRPATRAYEEASQSPKKEARVTRSKYGDNKRRKIEKK